MKVFQKQNESFKLVQIEDAIRDDIMYRECGVSWYGIDKRRQVEIGKDVFNYFSKKNRDIELEIEGQAYYSHLPDSFFSTCKHLRTAYDNPGLRGKNRLHEWIVKNNIKKVKLEAIEKFIKFRLVMIGL